MNDDLMTPAEVARAFGVNSKTVTRWAKAGRLPSIWTPGGHRRYHRSAVEALLSGVQQAAIATAAAQRARDSVAGRVASEREAGR